MTRKLKWARVRVVAVARRLAGRSARDEGGTVQAPVPVPVLLPAAVARTLKQTGA